MNHKKRFSSGGRQINDALKVRLLEQECNRLRTAMEARENAAVNFGKDAAMMAANDILGLGPGRAKAFSDKFDSYVDEMLRMAVEEWNTTEGDKRTMDIDVTMATIDRRILEIVGPDNFQPFEERYRNPKWTVANG